MRQRAHRAAQRAQHRRAGPRRQHFQPVLKSGTDGGEGDETRRGGTLIKQGDAALGGGAWLTTALEGLPFDCLTRHPFDYTRTCAMRHSNKIAKLSQPCQAETPESSTFSTLSVAQ